MNFKNAREIRDWFEYGLLSGEYDTLSESQQEVCAACGLPGGRRRLNVDHSHETGEVRCLLCDNCNRALGHVKDSIEVLLRLASIVQNPPAQALGLNRKAPPDEEKNEWKKGKSQRRSEIASRTGKEAWKKPEVRAKRTRSLKISANLPEERKRRSERTRKQWADPEKRETLLRARKKN